MRGIFQFDFVRLTRCLFTLCATLLALALLFLTPRPAGYRAFDGGPQGGGGNRWYRMRHA